jgi:hypothetical protein
MLREREYIHVDQPLDGMLEVGFPAETGESRSWHVSESRTWNPATTTRILLVIRRHQQGLWRSVLHVSPSFAELAISGPSRRWCEQFAATGSASNLRTATNGPCRGRWHHRAEGGASHPSVVGQARPK